MPREAASRATGVSGCSAPVDVGRYGFHDVGRIRKVKPYCSNTAFAVLLRRKLR